MIAGGLQDGHRVTIAGTVLPSGRSRHRTLSLSLTPKGATVLSAQEGPPASSEHPRLAQGMGRAGPANKTPATRHSIQSTTNQTLQRRGDGGSRLGREAGQPRGGVLGLNFLQDDPELQKQQLVLFPTPTLIYFRNLI